MEQNNDGLNTQGDQPVQPGQAASDDNLENIQQGAVNQDQQKFVSKAELTQILADQKREFQSLVDKNVSRVDKRVAEANRKAKDTLEMIKASNMQITPQQEAQIKNAAVTQALQVAEPPKQDPAIPAQGQQPQQLHTVEAKAAGILEGLDVSLDNNDPETKLVNTTTRDPNEYLASVKAAAIAKKARLEKGGSGPAGAPGALGSGGSGGNLQAMYDKERAQIPRGPAGAMKRTELNSKYREKGLHV